MTGDERAGSGVPPEASGWWRTEIIDIAPGAIRIRGYPIEQLIGRVGFASMIWLMLRGDLPSPGEAGLLEAALVAAVDHGPHAPSIAAARMAVTCGLDLNAAMATGANMLGDVHGGAGQQCMRLYAQIDATRHKGVPLVEAVTEGLEEALSPGRRFVPGFGHRFHPKDPRAGRLLDLVDGAREAGVVSGRFAEIGRAVEDELARRKGKRLPMNIDGATAVVFCELGFEPAVGRGLFVLSRSVGLLAHAWEEMQAGTRIKGPMPPSVPYTYQGPPTRQLEQP